MSATAIWNPPRHWRLCLTHAVESHDHERADCGPRLGRVSRVRPTGRKSWSAPVSRLRRATKSRTSGGEAADDLPAQGAVHRKVRVTDQFQLVGAELGQHALIAERPWLWREVLVCARLDDDAGCRIGRGDPKAVPRGANRLDAIPGN